MGRGQPKLPLSQTSSSNLRHCPLVRIYIITNRLYPTNVICLMFRMRLGFKYAKGYHFDHDKACQKFPCKPYTADTFQIIDFVVKAMNRDDYLTVVGGYRVGDKNMRTQFVFMLDGGDDPDDLDKRSVDLDSRPSIIAAQSFLSGPHIYVLQN